MSKKLDEVNDPRLIASGVYPSVDVLKAPLWVAGANVNFREASVQKIKGYEELVDVAGIGFGDINCSVGAFVEGERRAYFGSNNGLGYFKEGGVAQALFTGASPGFWSMIPWGSWLIATNGVDAPMIWKNTGLAAPIAAPFSFAQIVRVLQYHVVYFNTSQGADRFSWSSADNPELLTPAPENSAGGFTVRDIASPISAAELLGNDMAFYSLEKMYLLEYIGGQLVMGYNPVQAGVGALGKNVVVPVGQRHYGCDERGFWETDGVQETFIDEPPVRDHLKARIDFTRPNEIIGFHNRQTSQVEWFYPNIEGGYEGFAFDYKARHWAPRDYRISAAEEQEVFSGPLAGAGTKLIKLESGRNAGALALRAWVRSKPLDLGSSNMWKFIEEIRLRAEKLGGLVMRVGISESANGPIEWLPDFQVAEINQPLREAVFLTLEFDSTGLNDDWSISGMEFFGAVTGARV